MTHKLWVHFVSALVCLLTCFNLSANVQNGTNTNKAIEHGVQWFALLLEDDKIGHYKIARHAYEEAGTVTTKLSLSMQLTRAGTVVKVNTTEESVETSNGKPLRFSATEQQGDHQISVEGKIDDQGMVDILVKNGGESSKLQQKWPQDALLFEGQRLKAVEKGEVKGTQYLTNEYLIIAMTNQKSQVTVGETKAVNMLGKSMSLTEVTREIETKNGNIKVSTLVDDQHYLYKMVMPYLDSELHIVAVTEEVALGVDQQVDIFNKSFTHSPVPVTADDTKAQLNYRIMTNSDRVRFSPSDEQKVSRLENGEVKLQITPIKNTKGTFPYRGQDPELLGYLASNVYVQSGSEKIKVLANHAVGSSDNATKAAYKLERFVRNFISEKSLNVGYATALEVLNSREGDCTEHALLLVAMLKAIGIPARVATGVVYMDEFAEQQQAFVPHAWAQAYIDGQWLSFDAALPGFTSGHILLGYGNGAPLDFFNVTNTLGNFEITHISSQL